MITIQCVGNRRLEVTRRTDSMYEVRIMLHRGKRDLRLATLVIPEAEWKKASGEEAADKDP